MRPPIFFDLKCRFPSGISFNKMARGESGREGGAEGPPGSPNPRPGRPGGTPWVEVHLFRLGRGPIDIFRSSLGGRDQDRLEVRSILVKYGLKSLFAFKPPSERGFRIRFSPRDGTSLHPYRDGAVVFVDGEPKVNSSPWILVS